MTTIDKVTGFCLVCGDFREMVGIEISSMKRAFGKGVRRSGKCAECNAGMSTTGDRKDLLHPASNGIPPKREIPVPPKQCPRCEDRGYLDNGSDYYGAYVWCVMCGWQAEAPQPERKSKPMYRVRYVGDSKACEDLVLTIYASRGKMYATHTVICPWCGAEMEDARMSGTQKFTYRGVRVRTESYICEIGHSVKVSDHETHYTWR